MNNYNIFLLLPIFKNLKFLQNEIFTLNSPKYKEQQRLINEMDERELYKFNLQRGMDAKK